MLQYPPDTDTRTGASPYRLLLLTNRLVLSQLPVSLPLTPFATANGLHPRVA